MFKQIDEEVEKKKERKKDSVIALAISTFNLVNSDLKQYEDWSILFDNMFPFKES